MGLFIAASSNDNFKDDKMDIAKTALSIGPSIANNSFFIQ